jgi:hypothetical protein
VRVQSIEEFLRERKHDVPSLIVGDPLTDLDTPGTARQTVIEMCINLQKPPSDPDWDASSSVGKVFRHFLELPNKACISVRASPLDLLRARRRLREPSVAVDAQRRRVATACHGCVMIACIHGCVMSERLLPRHCS